MLASAVRGVVADLAAGGVVVEVVQGLRTFAEQDALYAQGRTAPGQIVTQARGGESNHNYGLAADLCPFTNGRPDWNAPAAVWARIGAKAIARGLDWGGQWKKFLDKPHVELPSMTVKECQRCFAEGGLEGVWATTTVRLEGRTRGLRRAKTRRTTARRPSAARKARTRKRAGGASARRASATRSPRRSRS